MCRGKLIRLVNLAWTSSNFVRYMTLTLLGLNLFYFVHSISAIWAVEDDSDLNTCDAKLSYFRHQRNCYITGGGLFLFVMLERTVSIQVRAVVCFPPKA